MKYFDNLKEKISNIDKKKLIIFIVFILAILYFFNNYRKKNLNHTVLLDNTNSFYPNNKFTLACFYTEWCGYSKKLLYTDRWPKVKDYYNKNGLVKVIEIDCDKQQKIANQFEIDAYPTIKLFISTSNGIQVITYDGNNESDSIITFVNKNINKYV